MKKKTLKMPFAASGTAAPFLLLQHLHLGLLLFKIILCDAAIQRNMHPTPIQATREFHLSS
jgi:hypothetical protein